MPGKIIITQIDAFTDQPFKGNPAAVCITSEPLPDTLMQQIANEMNLAETAFLVKKDQGFHLRWFTPVTEVALCGHATLASAHMLWDKALLAPEAEAVFHTLSGELKATKKEGQIILDFPAAPAKTIENTEVRELFNTKVLFTGKNQFDYLIELETEEDVLHLTPDFNYMAAIPSRGFIVTAKSDSPSYDFISRFFAPACGINEDPVTGSAHCCLAPYWSEKLGRKELLGYQASARGGFVGTAYLGERVLLKGKAVTVMHAELLLPQSNTRG